MLKRELLPTLPSLLAEADIPLIHRDMSWLQFNDRVLAEARQATNPLLERVKFLAISASNLDEFFMIRLPSTTRTTHKTAAESKSGGRVMKTRAAILETVAKFGAKQSEALDILTAELAGAGVHIIRQAHSGSLAFELGKRLFDEQILDKLSPPEAFHPSKLAALENLQTAVLFPSPTWRDLVWFKIPKSLPTVLLHRIGDGDSTEVYCFFLDDLLATHMGAAFRFTVNPSFLRLTRDGDFQLDLEEEDTESIPDVIRTGIAVRNIGRPTRLQYSGNLDADFLKRILVMHKLSPGQILPAPDTLNLAGLWTVVNQVPVEISQKPGLKYPAFKPSVPLMLRDETLIFENLKKRDVILHHPYDSFESYVQFIRAAVNDPLVESIEQTVYRMDVVSPVSELLKQAAKTKKVRIVIELRARFDELNNLRLADEFRKAGAEVAFGFGQLKLHAKVALVTRREAGGLKLYTHLSTGNYNASTARLYTDLALLTAHAEIGEDARGFFAAVMSGQVPTQFKHLVTAPTKLHRRLLGHIEQEMKAAEKGERGRIVAKVNALVDAEVIEQLYLASQKGVQVDLIVRGACALIPGVKGLSENIRVISVIDRYLEHSRIYYFGSSKKLYLSSADWMPRNFFSRLEVAFPILDPVIANYIEGVILPAYLLDNQKARELTSQGTWKRRTLTSTASRSEAPVSPAHGAVPHLFPRRALRSQFFFEELTAREYKGTPLEV